ncbi:MAG TPA: TetR/AcrR family transcriptional regulator [Intrasporangium sp.]|nr:TetR/AcrR family transcriptional regulator [Intrasporangium sp.]
MSPSTDPRRPLVVSRSMRKRQAILHAGRQLFLQKGYAGTSMDDVAAAADVSKVTIYKHFSDKQTLFAAVITDAIDGAKAASLTLVDQLGASTDIERDLRDFARRHVALVTQPHLVQMRRMIVAEAHRFPDLARTWHRSGPQRGHLTLAGQIDRLVDRGVLDAPDPLVAAQMLNYLILSVPLNEAMFTSRTRPFSPRYLNRYADEGVRVFLAAYGKRPGTTASDRRSP